jgi:ATP-dependent Clp protease protease subunit
MLTDYPGRVTVKIDGLAASAASVIAMAGDEVWVSPGSMIMIHNPATIAAGDHNEMQKAIEMLDGVKNSIINAYQTKTGLSRKKLSSLMEMETWMDANMAVELGFADGIIKREEASNEVTIQNEVDEPKAMLFSRNSMTAAVNKKLVAFCERASGPKPVEEPLVTDKSGRSVEECEGRLDLIKRFM